MDTHGSSDAARPVLEAPDIARVLTRIAHEIVERAKGADDVVLLGIPTRGVYLARRLADKLEEITGRTMPVGSLDITMYRDDLRLRPARALARTDIPGDGVDGRLVVLVDDVLFSGRTIRAALDALGDIGRPARYSSRSSSTAATANSRSAPTTSARTSPRRCGRRSRSCSPRRTVATPCCSVCERPPRPASSSTPPYAHQSRTDVPPARPHAAEPVRDRTPPAARPQARTHDLQTTEHTQMKRHLISAADLTRDDAVLILDTAEEMARVADRPIKKLPTLRGRTVVNLFFEDSTRTRISFEAAAKRLSADVINFSAKGSSVSKGESLKDTALTLEAMGADAVVIRHGASGAPYRLATSGWIDGAVVNAGDGTHEHPTQALLDAFTMRRRLVGADAGIGRGLDGRRITIVGDILHSRVARSNVLLLGTLGAHVTLVAPPTLVPIGVENWPCEVSYDLDEVLPKSDAVMMLRVQRERMNAAFFPTEREYSRRYGLDGDRMARMPEHAIVMHPGPMNRGMEITAQVADSDRCTAVEQVANGVSTRMAVLYLLLGGNEPAVSPTHGRTEENK